MKIIKIFGAVAAVHGLAFLLILAIPGCTTSSAPPPAAETVLGPSSNVPDGTNADFAQPAMTPTPLPAASASPAPLPDFDPNAPAISGMERYRPNRPTDEALPAPAGPATPAATSDVTPATTYTVVSGDNLWTISRRNGLTAAELAAANSIPVTAVIRPGQKLIIPNRTEAAAAPAGPT